MEAAADTPPSDAGQPAAVAALGVIIANDRDLRSLTWLREHVGDAAIEAAVAQLAGQRRPYVSNVAKALGIEIPSSLALTGVDTARARIAARAHQEEVTTQPCAGTPAARKKREG